MLEEANVSRNRFSLRPHNTPRHSNSAPLDPAISDLELVAQLSNWTVDLTFGSALDIFGGKGVSLDECVNWNKEKGGARLVRIR